MTTRRCSESDSVSPAPDRHAARRRRARRCRRGPAARRPRPSTVNACTHSSARRRAAGSASSSMTRRPRCSSSGVACASSTFGPRLYKRHARARPAVGGRRRPPARRRSRRRRSTSAPARRRPRRAIAGVDRRPVGLGAAAAPSAPRASRPRSSPWRATSSSRERSAQVRASSRTSACSSRDVDLGQRGRRVDA